MRNIAPKPQENSSMPLNRWTRFAVPLALALLLGVAACGGSNDGGGGGAVSSGSKDGVTLKAAVFSWTAAAVETDILAAIAQEHPELGVKGIDQVKLDPAAGWVGLQRGDVDLLTEANLPNQQPFADKAKVEVDLASKVYGGAVQGWFVPRYAVEGPNAPLAGLKSIDQLNQYKDKLGDTLYDGDPGWITTQQDDKRLKAYGLQLKHVKSSEAALIAQVQRASARKQPLLFFFYRPHWLFSRYDVVQLKEPNPYKPGCFTGSNDKCAIPTQSAWIADRKDLAQRAPKFAAMLEHVQIPLGEIETLLNQVDQKKRDPANVAKAWVDAHKSEVDGWIG
jgi:glycine betaine/proline transport system substrate-binding protein